MFDFLGVYNTSFLRAGRIKNQWFALIGFLKYESVINLQLRKGMVRYRCNLPGAICYFTFLKLTD